ncbi:flagellin lysine-N-methylase [Paenibacillus illinoisensis]|uniref:flagellin lysine-N-methylase n=1 Tax=Paenibacillus illinoisensis TaxID=59845 RepID=UPI00203F3FD4|nr:flagellin lysine-N-methylase [Paenibacillus illinoisensis]MCM3208585.1 flagellin lysine-N-methylase [Paenibacillus illinoisensis]
MQKETLMPTYMKKFSCIGSACEDSCCVGWRVTLDKKTFKNYKNLKHPVLSKQLHNSMKRIKNETSSDSQYAYFVMDDKKRCPMLQESGLCGIQATVGEQMLSSTCTTYPRVINRVDNIYEMSAKLSCPEIARLALLNPDGIEFEHTESDMNSAWGLRDDFLNSSKHENGENFFWDLRVFAIEIIQNRSLYLSDRMIFLGIFINKVQSLVANKEYDKINSIIEEYKIKLYNPEFVTSLSKIHSNPELQLRLVVELIQKRNDSGGEVPRYIECYVDMYKGFGIQQEDTFDLEELKIMYQKNYNNYYVQFMDNYGFVLENYLVNYVFESLFPNVKNKDIFKQFTRMSVLYSMLRIHLVGVAGYYEGLSEEMMVKVIQSFARVVEHNMSYLSSITDLLQKNGLDTLAHVVSLLKE